MSDSRVRRLLRGAAEATGTLLSTGWAAARQRASATGRTREPRRGGSPHPGQEARGGTPPPHGDSGYPGDYRGPITPVYAPQPDGAPDPGEIVWTWVPYEEDHRHGKDRPVLLLGRDGGWLLGLMLTSRDHDAAPEREQPRPRGRGPAAAPHARWFDLGVGEWDSRRRPSEVRLDRVVRIDPARVRREGCVLDRARFDAVVASLGEAGGW